mgnify:CR=1 FL=1
MAENLIFEKIMADCQEKKIISCCKKLIKKSRLTSGETAQNLCHLAYWLYVYGYINDALEVCEFSHLDIPKPFAVNYNIWDFVLYVWGLEAYIHRKQGDEQKCQEIIEKMKTVWLLPNGCLDTADKQEKSFKRICQDMTFEFVINKNKIDRCITEGDKRGQKAYSFTALFGMIAYGVTGIYPQLENHKEELEIKIEEYINLLR